MALASDLPIDLYWNSDPLLPIQVAIDHCGRVRNGVKRRQWRRGPQNQSSEQIRILHHLPKTYDT